MFQVEIPAGYPNDAPKVSLETVPIYHPNINYEGKKKILKKKNSEKKKKNPE